MNKTIQRELSDKEGEKCAEQDVLSTTAMMIGSVAISRALNDKRTTKKLLESCRQSAKSLLKLSV